jgi:hypothetical protein
MRDYELIGIKNSQEIVLYFMENRIYCFIIKWQNWSNREILKKKDYNYELVRP